MIRVMSATLFCPVNVQKENAAWVGPTPRK